MRIHVLRLLLVLLTLTVLSPIDAAAQTRVVRRLGDVRSFYVDRDSFEIDGPPCTKGPGKIFETCGPIEH